jgi:hypothetical protein
MMQKQAGKEEPSAGIKAARAFGGFLLVLGVIAATFAAGMLTISAFMVLDGNTRGAARTQLVAYGLGGAGVLTIFLGSFLRGKGS